MCDSCEAWQHNECMEMSLNDNELPVHYYCEQCRPDSHRDLLERVNRGEKPWEELARKRQQEEEERQARKRKGGKKGRKSGRPSDIKPELKHEPPKANGAPEPAPTAIPPPIAPELKSPAQSTQKRKLPNDSPEQAQTPINQVSKTYRSAGTIY